MIKVNTDRVQVITLHVELSIKSVINIMIINHQQFDNIHGMKIFQNIDERRNIVVTQQ